MQDWRIFPWFLSVLFAMRIVPVVFRKTMPFSDEVRTIWFDRRRLAKNYDSYQWRKLWWIGIGVLCSILSFGYSGSLSYGLAGFCLISGAVAEQIWRRRGNPEVLSV